MLDGGAHEKLSFYNDNFPPLTAINKGKAAILKVAFVQKSIKLFAAFNGWNSLLCNPSQKS